MRLILAVPCLFVLTLNSIGAADRFDQAKPGTQARKDVCVDEQVQAFSNGSLRKVAGQVQKCEAGVWVIDEMNGPQDPVLARQKPCVGIEGQQYAAGVLRLVKEKVERCRDGKWIGSE